MSRSYKKHPWYTDGRNGQKKAKQFANKVVRKYNSEIKNGNYYKKLFCSYNIHDYISRWTWKQAKDCYKQSLNFFYYKKHYKNLKEFYNYWSKYYKRK